MAPTGRELENDPDNPCFGCGPNNPIGLRLRFYAGRGRVRARRTFGPEYSGFPGVVSPWVCRQAVQCAILFTLYARTGQTGPSEDRKEKFLEYVRVGAPVDIVGRVLSERRGRYRIRVELRQQGRLKYWTETRRRLYASLAEFQEDAAGIPLSPMIRALLPAK